MRRNLASPAARLRTVDPMAEHDRLPAPLRLWSTTAALPWSARSLRRVWTRALRETGCVEAALAQLSRAERATLAREAALAGLRPPPGD